MVRRIRHHGIVQFPWELPLSPDALGLKERIRVGDTTIELALPIAESGKLTTPLDYRGLPLEEPLQSTFANQWGYRSTTRLYYVRAARASFLLPRTDNIPGLAEYRNLSDEFLAWFEIVQYWAAAWSHQLPRPLGIGQSHNSVFYVPTGGGYMAGSGARAGAVFFGAEPLTLEQLRGALRRASRGEHLPLEHRLLISAEVAHLDHDLRQAVIDAGSSAEVALGTAVAEYLRAKRIAEDFIEQAIVNANGIVGLTSLYNSLGSILPVSRNRVANELARVRNEAAHGGRTPTHNQALQALQHARTLVQAARPLPNQ